MFKWDELHCRFGFYAALGIHPAMLSQDIYMIMDITRTVIVCYTPKRKFMLLLCHMPLITNSEAHRPWISGIQHHLLERIDPSTSFHRRQDSVIVPQFLSRGCGTRKCFQ